MKKLLSLITLITLASCSGSRPTDIGVNDNKLKACPDKPNCVVSYPNSPDQDHFIDPLKPLGNPSEEFQKISTILKGNSAFKIIKSEPNYLYAEYTSAIFRFVDDVEFHLSSDGLIHMRSASRIGRSDWGANRKRLEMVRFKYAQKDF